MYKNINQFQILTICRLTKLKFLLSILYTLIVRMPSSFRQFNRYYYWTIICNKLVFKFKDENIVEETTFSQFLISYHYQAAGYPEKVKYYCPLNKLHMIWLLSTLCVRKYFVQFIFIKIYFQCKIWNTYLS